MLTKVQLEEIKKARALIEQAQGILNSLYPSLDHQTKAYQHFRDAEDDVRMSIEGLDLMAEDAGKNS